MTSKFFCFILGNTSTPKLSSRESMPNNISASGQHGHNSSTDSLMFGDCVPSRPTHTSAIQIAIDWDPTALHLRYQSTRERVNIQSIDHTKVERFYLCFFLCLGLDRTRIGRNLSEATNRTGRFGPLPEGIHFRRETGAVIPLCSL